MALAQMAISTAPAAPSMWPVAPLVEADRQLAGVLAEDGLDGLGLADVALRRRGAVGVDVGDVRPDSAGGAQGHAHAAGGAFALGGGGGDMVASAVLP